MSLVAEETKHDSSRQEAEQGDTFHQESQGCTTLDSAKGDCTPEAAQQVNMLEAGKVDSMLQENQGRDMMEPAESSNIPETTQECSIQESSQLVDMKEAPHGGSPQESRLEPTEIKNFETTQEGSIQESSQPVLQGSSTQESMQETDGRLSMQDVTEGSSTQEAAQGSDTQKMPLGSSKKEVVEQGAKQEPAHGGTVPESRRDWIESHPKFLEMMALNTADSAHVYTAFLVYLDLLEGRNWYDVRYKALRDLQQICLFAQEKEGQSSQVVVPTTVHLPYSDEWIKQVMARTCYAEDTPPSVMLAIVESDSTVVYYKLTEGFVVPEPPDNIQDIDNKQFRKKRRKL